MAEIKIETGVPVQASIKHGKPFTYPFDKLEVGQSFFIKGKASGDIGNFMASAKLRLRRGFISRTMDGGVRVWRTE